MNGLKVALAVSITGVAVLAGGGLWLWGYMAGTGTAWPGERAAVIVHNLKSLLQYGEFVPEGRRMPAPLAASREPFTIHDPEAAQGDGFYAVFGWDGGADHYAVWLWQADGTLAHKWPVDEQTFARARQSANGAHAMLPLRDGSILVSYDRLPLIARLDACGGVIWSQRGYHHHAFSASAEGGVWTWYSELNPYGEDQHLVRFDPRNGQHIETISLAGDIVGDSAEVAALLSLPQDFRFRSGPNQRNLFHPNDVEELFPDMAAAFPMFEPGDLLFSFRWLNLIAVIGRDGEVKWAQTGPWREQHDPDFRPDGTITVFDNRSSGPSAVVAANPATGRTVNLTGGIERPFATRKRGRQETLPAGNLLITVPEQGQVLEMAPDGRIVLEINNVSVFSDAYNEDITNARWLPADYFAKMPACPG